MMKKPVPILVTCPHNRWRWLNGKWQRVIVIRGKDEECSCNPTDYLTMAYNEHNDKFEQWWKKNAGPGPQWENKEGFRRAFFAGLDHDY